MRFFASWWERIPVREAAPMLLMVLAFGFAFGHAGGNAEGFVKALFSPVGFTWG